MGNVRFDSELMRGSLDLLVLTVLAEEPRYGYAISRRLEEATGGLIQVAAGTLYPLLHRLEADGLIASRWDDSTNRRRKWYELTEAGRARLTQQARQWQVYSDCLGRMLRPILDASPKPV